VYFDQVPELDWDREIRKAIPSVLESENKNDCYRILQELVALLNDGHTFILPPMEELDSLDHPALEMQMVDGRVIITRTGDSKEITERELVSGLEVVEVDGVSSKQFLEESMRFYSGGTEHWRNAFRLSRLLDGVKDSSVRLKVKDLDGNIRDVELTRNSETVNGETFTCRVYDYDPLVEVKTFDDVVYIRLSTFIFEQIVDDFSQKLDQIDLEKVRGMIIDIRYNIGGNSDHAFKILSRLVDEPVQTARWRTRRYLPAYRAWGRPEGWHEEDMGTVEPSTGSRYSSPLIILTGHNTVSAAEDFLVPLKYSKRAKIVGELTAGSTGNPLTIQLPGGYALRVCSKRDTFPDGEEFVGIGIEPDIKISNTQEDIYIEKDRVLEKALELINSRKEAGPK